MKNDEGKGTHPSRWLLLTASALSGWNIFVLVCLFSLIGIAALLAQLEVAIEPRGLPSYMIFTFAGLVSIAVGFLASRKIYKILGTKTRKYCHISLFFILIVTILLFPRIFYYTVVS